MHGYDLDAELWQLEYTLAMEAKQTDLDSLCLKVETESYLY